MSDADLIQHALGLVKIYGSAAREAGHTDPLAILFYALDRERKVLRYLATPEVRDAMAEIVYAELRG